MGLGRFLSLCLSASSQSDSASTRVKGSYLGKQQWEALMTPEMPETASKTLMIAVMGKGPKTRGSLSDSQLAGSFVRAIVLMCLCLSLTNGLGIWL